MALSLPYREESRSPLAFSLSVLLHGLAAAAIVAFLWNHPAPPPPPPPKAFELMAGPAPDDSPPSPDQSPGLTSQQFQNLPPTPQAEPPTQTTPQAKPVSVPVKSVSPIPIHNDKTAPKPPASTSKATDLKSFQQSHPAANPATTATVRRGTAPNVGVNVTNLVNTLNQGGRGAAHPTASSGTSDDYVKKLIARLHDALKLPGGISGLSADVSLKIAADGTVVSAVLERASGNDQFDAAVQTALQEITQVEPPPGGKEVTYLFTYVPPAP